mmetsp:Transcript_23891/g.23585  ORF Transcript_23891/g.23585 Transcript_23891/m.23585 type:complete len:103 (-) Transcript_23891:234-542(-)
MKRELSMFQKQSGEDEAPIESLVSQAYSKKKANEQFASGLTSVESKNSISKNYQGNHNEVKMINTLQRVNQGSFNYRASSYTSFHDSDKSMEVKKVEREKVY